MRPQPYWVGCLTTTYCLDSALRVSGLRVWRFSLRAKGAKLRSQAFFEVSRSGPRVCVGSIIWG